MMISAQTTALKRGVNAATCDPIGTDFGGDHELSREFLRTLGGTPVGDRRHVAPVFDWPEASEFAGTPAFQGQLFISEFDCNASATAANGGRL